jgi:hypothetical protein
VKNKLVNLVENWAAFEDCVGGRLGFYQLLERDEKVEIRVSASGLGYKREFETLNDPLVARILGFCQRRQFIRIGEKVRDAFFR